MASTLAVAASLEPDLIILVLHDVASIQACEELRNVPETRLLRVLLVLERTHLSQARMSGASAIVVQPASALMLAVESKRVLERTERRCVWQPDRRGGPFRGGRRSTDIASG